MGDGDETTPQLQASMQTWVAECFPEMAKLTITYWPHGFTADAMPLIGRLPDSGLRRRLHRRWHELRPPRRPRSRRVRAGRRASGVPCSIDWGNKADLYHQVVDKYNSGAENPRDKWQALQILKSTYIKFADEFLSAVPRKSRWQKLGDGRDNVFCSQSQVERVEAARVEDPAP